MPALRDLKIKIFADGADKDSIFEMAKNPLISGFTTNPTLMRKAGVKDYSAFAKEIARLVPDKPLSFEVFSDEFTDMERQAELISGWGPNVFVKIPITNTKGASSIPLIKRLANKGVQVNTTALMTLSQVREAANALRGGPTAYISLFAGRIADSGRDAAKEMKAAVKMIEGYPNLEMLWASTREVWNIFEANQVGCQIITVPNSILNKLELVGRDLDEFSLETVKMFYDDAQAAGYTL